MDLAFRITVLEVSHYQGFLGSRHMKSGVPGAADITPPLPGEINYFSRIRVQITLTQDPVHAAIDTPSTEKAPGAFIEECTQRLGPGDDHQPTQHTE